MKGVLLAGGMGTRLQRLTKVTNKHLLPIYNRPMIDYSLATLLSSGIPEQEICVVTGGEHFADVTKYLSHDYPQFAYFRQEKAGGIAQALGLTEKFIGKDNCFVVLGDNIIQDSFCSEVQNFTSGAMIFLKEIGEDRLWEKSHGVWKAKYGIAEVIGDTVVGIEEKPEKPKTNYAVIGAYFYDPTVFEYIKTLQPSQRGELEITDVNNWYIGKGEMKFKIIQGYWLDAGATVDSLGEASNMVKYNPPRSLEYLLPQ